MAIRRSRPTRPRAGPSVDGTGRKPTLPRSPARWPAASPRPPHQLGQPGNSRRDPARFVVGERPAVEMPAKAVDEIDVGHGDAVGRVDAVAAGSPAHAPGRRKASDFVHAAFENKTRTNATNRNVLLPQRRPLRFVKPLSAILRT